jgi:hypothetical protein
MPKPIVATMIKAATSASIKAYAIADGRLAA